MGERAQANTHRERIARAFSQQAGAFEDRRVNQPFSGDAAWLFERVARASSDLVLDVAAGTGHVARSFAGEVRAVVAFDATEEMLRRGQAAAEAEGHRNIVFISGDAVAMPFLDGGFDIVVCRFALHHFERPAEQLAEMRRCLRAGGRLGIADLIADPDPAVAPIQNELERLRDPSHTWMFPAGELLGLVDALDVSDVTIESRPVQRPLAPWLDQGAQGDQVAREIRERLEAELDGGEVTGFSPRIVDGEIWFVQTFASVVAVAA